MKRSAALAALILGVTGVISAPTAALASTGSVPKCPISVSRAGAAIPGCMRAITFNMSAGNSWGTEVSGPRLLIFEEVLYKGAIYHLAAVHGHGFRLERDGRIFVDHGKALHREQAYVYGVGETRY